MKYLEDFYNFKNNWNAELLIEERIYRLEEIVTKLVEVVGGNELAKYEKKKDEEFSKHMSKLSRMSKLSQQELAERLKNL